MNELSIRIFLKVVGILTTFFSLCWLVITATSLVGAQSVTKSYGVTLPGPVAEAGTWYIVGINGVGLCGIMLFITAPVLAQLACKR